MNSLERLAPALPAVVEPPPSSLRGRRYGEDRLYLLVRDPRSVLAVWELTPELHARAQERARERGHAPRYRIVIERRPDANAVAGAVAFAAVDLPDALGGERWYVRLPEAGGECRALLGISLGQDFEPLLHSSWVPVPPDGPCAEEGAWDLTTEARAWLLERSRAGRAPAAGMSSAARYQASLPPGKAPR